MAGLILALLILLLLCVRWQWDIHAGSLLVVLNSSYWERPFVCSHGPSRLPWWQYVKVMPHRCTGPAGSWPWRWNVFVYTRRTTRCHFIAWRPKDRRGWHLHRRELRDWTQG